MNYKLIIEGTESDLIYIAALIGAGTHRLLRVDQKFGIERLPTEDKIQLQLQEEFLDHNPQLTVAELKRELADSESDLEVEYNRLPKSGGR